MRPGEVRQNSGWIKLEAAAGPSYVDYHAHIDPEIRGAATGWRAEIRPGFNAVNSDAGNIYLDPLDLMIGGGGNSIVFAAMPSLQLELFPSPVRVMLRGGVGFGKRARDAGLNGDVAFGGRAAVGLKIEIRHWHLSVEYGGEGYVAPDFGTTMQDVLFGVGVGLR